MLTCKNEVPCCKGILMKNSHSNGNITVGELYWRFLGQCGFRLLKKTASLRI